MSNILDHRSLPAPWIEKDRYENCKRNWHHRCQTRHIHDHDLLHDNHQLPFSMGIDYEPIVKALKEIDYQGYFTLEAGIYLNAYSPENVFDGLVKLRESARKLADMFEAL